MANFGKGLKFKLGESITRKERERERERQKQSTRIKGKGSQGEGEEEREGAGAGEGGAGEQQDPFDNSDLGDPRFLNVDWD